MGCGACGPCGENSMVSKPHQQTSLESRVLDSLRKIINYNDFVRQDECKQLMMQIQHSHLSLFDKKNHKNPQQAQATMVNIDQNVQLQESYLISAYQRTLWKVLLFCNNKNLYKDGGFIREPSTNNHPKLQKQFQQISRDVHRTFPKVLPQKQRVNLKIVLQNINIYYPTVGYTQGMNYFIGFFLLCGFTAEQSFWIFIYLSRDQNYMMILNFSSDFAMPKYNIQILQEELTKKSKQVIQTMEKYGISSYFYSFSWFLCYFLYTLTPKCCAKIWGYVLRKGSVKYFLTISIQIMQKLKAAILEAQNAQELLTIFRQQRINKFITQENIQEIIMESENIQISDKEYFSEQSQIGKSKYDNGYYEQLIRVFQQLEQ